MVELPAPLKVGDRCWFYQGVPISFVDIIECKAFKGTHTEFVLYKVVKTISGHEQTAHRSELFKVPEERQRLLEAIRSDIHRLRDYVGDLQEQDDDYVPDPEKEEV